MVLENQNTNTGKFSQLAAENPMLANLAGLGGSLHKAHWKQVKILESPSVLKPVYEFVIRQRKSGEKVDSSSF